MRFNADEHTKAFRDVDPDAYTAAAYTGAGVDTKGYEYATFIVNLGTLGTNATVDFEVQESADDSTYADIDSSSSITQQTQAGTDASDSVVALTIKCAGRQRYLRGKLTVGTATSDVGSCGFLSVPMVLPAV